MKTTLPFVHFCDHASMSTDGKLNLVGIFESLFAMEIPTRYPQMYILTRFDFPKGNHEVTLTLMQEDRVLAKTHFQKEVTKKSEPQNHLWAVFELPLETWDAIQLKVFENGTEVGQAELPIYRLPKPFKTSNK